MYDFNQLQEQINQSSSQGLTQDDIDFLNLYHNAMTRSDQVSDEGRNSLSSGIFSKLNDVAFLTRIATFGKTIRENKDGINNEFPYLDVLQNYLSPIPSDELVNNILRKIKNNEALPNDEIELLKKLKENAAAFPRCIEVFNQEKKLTLPSENNLGHLSLELEPIDLGLYKVNQAIIASKVLNEDYKKFFLIYNRVMNGTTTLDDSDKAWLSQELVKTFEDKNFNRILTEFEKEMKAPEKELEEKLKEMKKQFGAEPSESEQKAIDDIKKQIDNIKCDFGYLDVIKGYSYEVKRLNEIQRAIEKGERAKEITEQGGTLEEEEKLSLSDLSLLQKSNKLKRLIDLFVDKGINEALSVTEPYKKVVQQNARVKLLEKHMNYLFDETSKAFQSGDVLVTEMDKTKEYSLKATSFLKASKEALFEGKYQELIDKFKRPFTKYGHAAQLTEVNGQIKQSHMWGEHRIDKFALKDLAESAIFRVNISKLVAPYQLNQLELIYGEKWKEELQKLYAQKVAEVAMDPKLKKLKIIGGAHAAPALLPDIPYYLGVNNDNYKGLFFKEGLQKKEVICSDFVAREIVEAMRLLNEELEKKGLKIPIVSPIPNNVNLARVAPERLIKLLALSGCLEQVETKEINSFLKNRAGHYSGVDRQLSKTEALYEKVGSLAKRCSSKDEFVKEAKIAFIVYLTTNDNLSKKSYTAKNEEINKYLDGNLGKLYDAPKHSDNRILQFFCEVLEKLHIIAPPRNKQSELIINEAMIQFKVNEFSIDEPMLQAPHTEKNNVTAAFKETFKNLTSGKDTTSEYLDSAAPRAPSS